MENISPTQEALLQHAKHATYQAGIWATSDQVQQHAPSAEGYGWTWDTEAKTWLPVWSRLPIAAKACSELVRCGCKSGGVGQGEAAKKPAGSALNSVAANVKSS